MLPEARCIRSMFELQSIAVELLDRGSCNDYSCWIGKFQNIKSQKESLAERGDKSIVWRRGECKYVYSGRGLCAVYNARDVRRSSGLDRESEEGCHCEFIENVYRSAETWTWT